MLRIAVLGCGRIGRMHAANIARHPRTSLAMVYDVHAPSATALAESEGTRAAESAGEVLASTKVDAVLIATATPTHADYIEMAVDARKPALCEKPIDLDLARVEACKARIAGASVPVQIGFNRRFDPGHRAAKEAVAAGDIGDLHQVVITSRDPRAAIARLPGGRRRAVSGHDHPRLRSRPLHARRGAGGGLRRGGRTDRPRARRGAGRGGQRHVYPAHRERQGNATSTTRAPRSTATTSASSWWAPRAW